MVDEESKGVSKFSQTIIFSGPAVDDSWISRTPFFNGFRRIV